MNAAHGGGERRVSRMTRQAPPTRYPPISLLTMSKRPSPTTHPNAESFPAIGGPALRALHNAGIRSLHELRAWRERDLSSLHGMGPKGVRLLKDALIQQQMSLRAD